MEKLLPLIITSAVTLFTSAVGLVVWSFKINNAIDKKIEKAIKDYGDVQKILKEERDKRFVDNYKNMEKEIEELNSEKERVAIQAIQADDRFRELEIKLVKVETKLGDQ